MMLQVKNSKILLLLVGALALIGCEPADPFVDPSGTPNPEWTLTVENDPASSMTAVVKVSFTDKEGVLAAFIGDDCCAVTTSSDFVDGLYYLYISPSEKGDKVLLKFYSPDLKRSFTSTETFLFVNGSNLGNVAEPYTPNWQVQSN